MYDDISHHFSTMNQLIYGENKQQINPEWKMTSNNHNNKMLLLHDKIYISISATGAIFVHVYKYLTQVTFTVQNSYFYSVFFALLLE